MSLKSINFFFYKNFFNFSFYIFNSYILILKYNIFIKFFNLIKFIFYINNLKIFLPNYFQYNNLLFCSFWMNGFISNFNVTRWVFFKKFKKKKLPYILINLSQNKLINMEIKKKKIPLINFNNNNLNFTYDYFFYDNQKFFLSNGNLDYILYFMFIFNYLKLNKNITNV